MPTILIIEDYQSLLEIYEEQFRTQGFTVSLATNGEEGLKLAQADDFDVILLDLLMPGMDGFEFLEAYNAPKHPHTKVIILSNAYTPENVSKALELGANQYLLKSDITPERITEIAQQALNEK